jgi:hypothetical protein
MTPSRDLAPVVLRPPQFSTFSIDPAIKEACGGSVSGLPECSEISQQPLDFTKSFATYTG